MRHRRTAARSWQVSAPLFAALGDERRLRVLARLCDEGPLSIARLTEGEAVTRQAMTKHIHVLEDAGLVRGAQEGRESVWRLEPRRLVEARRLLAILSHQWDETLERLRAFVEEPDGEGRTTSKAISRGRSARRGGQNMRAHRNM